MPQGRCPNNGCVLNYNDGDKFVDCPYCDTKHSIAELETATRRESSKTESKVRFGAGVPAILGFDNPESGVVFIQNFFDTYDWEAFKETPELEIDEISEVVYNNKMKNGAVGTSWYIDFKSVSVPLLQKINGLKELAVKIGSKYNTQDASECMALFDVYRQIIVNVAANKDVIIKRLEAAVKYAQAFALEGNRLKEIQAEFKQISAIFNDIKEVKEIEEIPEYIDAQNKASVEIEKKLKKRALTQKIFTKKQFVYLKLVAQENLLHLLTLNKFVVIKIPTNTLERLTITLILTNFSISQIRISYINHTAFQFLH